MRERKKTEGFIRLKALIILVVVILAIMFCCL